MHIIRQNLSEACVVCAAMPGEPCVRSKVQLVREYDPGVQPGTVEWLEFNLLRDCKALKEADPDHWLVKAIESACTNQSEQRNSAQGKSHL